MEYSLNEYKEYRKHKLNLIHKRILKCQNIINDIQTGGDDDITKEKIDNNFDNIRSQLIKLGKKIQDINTTGIPTSSCCNAFDTQTDKIKELIDLFDKS